MLLQDKVFTTVIQSGRLSDLPLYTVMYNKADFSEIVCVKLPPQMPRDMQLIEIYNLNSSEDLDFADFVTRDENRPWIDIQSSILDTTAGQHTYRMTFAKEDVKLTATCWFSYIIQDNEPEKPYIYMMRDGASSSDTSSNSQYN